VKRTLLIIMDGWGLREETEANAVRQASTPVVDRLWQEYPHTTLVTSGRSVGLPEGQMGNSEVGHLNLGAGRVVYQDIQRISRAIENGEFFQNEVLLDAMKNVRKGGRLHLMGLVSDGGVHSLQAHLNALIDMAGRHNIENVCVHAVLDGRDTSPTGGVGYLGDLQQTLRGRGTGRIATVMGRYFCMDRDKRWERTKRAYDAFVSGTGKQAPDPLAALRESYDMDVTDEFVEPIVVVDDKGEPLGEVTDGDVIIFFNFRADRARQISRAFTDADFEGFEREPCPNVRFYCMTEYDRTLGLPVIFQPVRMTDILGEVTAAAGLRGLRIAETEKYAHVTYFFNGGEETSFSGEDRVLVPSPKVATYDLQPEMSANEVTDKLVALLDENRHDYIICNFANPDMVGHTGVLEAAVKAVETVDTCVGRVIDALDLDKDVVIVTADHGNAEMMIDPTTGGPHTAHTTNPVPCILVDRHYKGELITDGSLRDIAPTMCNYLGVSVPEAMTGRDLRVNFSSTTDTP
jgi:2,3-bisphosphoglycerate-independent phosphoglycerate mutase